jgi:hypothetical protein
MEVGYLVRLLLTGLIFIFPFTAFSTNILLQQNFGSDFPPTGWSTSYSGIGAEWRLMGGDAIQGYYAQGNWFTLGGPDAWDGTATLTTPNFNLSQGQQCVIRFKRRCTRYNSFAYYYKVALQVDDDIVWSQFFADTPSWTLTNCITPPLASSSPIYRALWEVHGVQNSFDAGYVDFDVDDVTVFSTGVAVEPTSLGGIKASFE